MSKSSSSISTYLTPEQVTAMDARVRKMDEDRWLSSRYAGAAEREALTALYAFNYELARVRLVVSEPGLGAIRFQWWRDAIGEIEAGKEPRKHDVALALAGLLGEEVLKPAALTKLIDGYEAAFDAEDRSREPEAWLMAVAARVLLPTHGWGEAIQQVAPAYAATRRGETKAFGPVVAKAPAPIRPAVAHARLRKLYAGGSEPGRMQKRLSVMRGVMSGGV